MLHCVKRNAMAKEKIRETGNIFNYDMNNTNITLFACELHWRKLICIEFPDEIQICRYRSENLTIVSVEKRIHVTWAAISAGQFV